MRVIKNTLARRAVAGTSVRVRWREAQGSADPALSRRIPGRRCPAYQGLRQGPTKSWSTKACRSAAACTGRRSRAGREPADADQASRQLLVCSRRRSASSSARWPNRPRGSCATIAAARTRSRRPPEPVAITSISGIKTIFRSHDHGYYQRRDLSTNFQASIMEIVELVKMLEDKLGVSAAAPVAVAAVAAAAAPAAEEQTEFTVTLKSIGENKVGVIKAIRTITGPGPQGGQGPGRGRALRRQGSGLEGRRRDHQEAARRSRRHRRDQVTGCEPMLIITQAAAGGQSGVRR